ncbi:MAG: hypothetical protein VW338_00065 [Rhodospirillaceae bacterium]
MKEHASDILGYVITPVLAAFQEVSPRLRSEAAAYLLLGTAMQESHGKYITQIKGPALSWWQIEPATIDDIWFRYLVAVRPDLRSAVKGWLPYHIHGTSPLSVICNEVAANPRFACALARIRYWWVKPPLPEANDVKGLGAYWNDHYNCNPTKGTVPEFIASWREHIGPVDGNGVAF